MWLKALAIAAILLFVVWLVAVLQAWSHSTATGRLISVGFVLGMATLAFWGVRTLIGSH